MDTWPLLLGMKPFLQQAWHQAGFKNPTPVQEQVVPLIVAGKDVIAQSPTGTGKTVAYLLPVLEKIDPEKKTIQVVVLAPSHELAMQIFQTIQSWAKGSRINSASLIGGANVKKQLEHLKGDPQIVVGTIGRILELIKAKKMKMHDVKTIVVDEFDVFIGEQHLNSLKSVIKTTLKQRQLVFFSATLPEATEAIGKELMNNPELIRINHEKGQASHVQHGYVLCEERDKIEVLEKIFRTGQVKGLAFVNDLNQITDLEAKLKYKKVPLGVITGGSDKNQRKQALKDFRADKISLLIATDVAARGLDIEGLTHVINYELPFNPNQYLHRSGRTGRMGASGTVISLVTKEEQGFIKKINSKLGISIEKKRLYGGKIID